MLSEQDIILGDLKATESGGQGLFDERPNML